MSSSSDDLIVDFPRNTRSGRRCRSSDNSNAKRKVRFSPTGQVRYYERPDPLYRSDMHYAPREYDAFKRENRRDVRDVHRLLDASSSNNTNKDVLLPGDCVLTGIENLLTPRLIRRSVATKSGLTGAVLAEQERQYAGGTRDEERMARIARHYSERSVRRSTAIGTMNRQDILQEGMKSRSCPIDRCVPGSGFAVFAKSRWRRGSTFLGRGGVPCSICRRWVLQHRRR